MSVILHFYSRLVPRFRNPLYLSIFLAALIHVAGAIGMIFFDRDSFVRLTPVNLILMFILLMWNEGRIKADFLVIFLVGFLSGVVTEIIGVNTGLLFGRYQYGNLFGEKLFGVPLVIGVNWFCIVYASYCMVKQYLIPSANQKILISILTAFVATVFDFIMEPVAVKLDFWTWEGGIIPFYNYLSWVLISLSLTYFFEQMRVSAKNVFAPILLCIQVVFFIFLRFGL